MSRRVLPLILLCTIAVLIAALLWPRPGPAAATPVTPAAGDWPQWQRNAQHQGSNNATTVAPPLAARWTTDLGSFVNGQVVANGVVYVTTQDVKIRALDAATGGVLWTYQSDGPGLYPPVYDAGTVFVLNAGGPGGTVQHVVALDANTGAFKWVQSLTGGRGTDGAVPAVGNGVVYVAGGDWKVHAFDEQTGAVLWRTGVDDGAVSSPAIGGSFVYASTFNAATLYAFEPLTGAVRWSVKADGNWYENNPIVDGNRVYTGGTGNRVHAVDALTGSFIWTTSVPTPIACTPALGNGILYKSYFDYGTATVYTFDATTGTRRWTYQLPNASGCPAVTLGNGIAYVRAYNGGLITLDGATGLQLDQFKLNSGGFVSSPAIGPDAIYLGTSDGKLYALAGQPATPAPTTPAPTTPTPATPLPTRTPTPMPGTPGPVGGISLDAQLPGSSEGDAGLLAGVIAGAMAGAIALGGAAWYARRRRVR